MGLTTTPLRFVHIGFTNMICANRVTAVMPLGSAMSKRLIKEAKESRHFMDMTSGKSTKSLLILDDGTLVSCAISSKTIVGRLNAAVSIEDDLELIGESP